jgi:AcrR family transcriptional regulator
MEVVARRGYDATVEEIAQLSGVSPRTIFRHYTSHDRLIVATVKDIFEACGRPAEDLGDDLGAWIESMAVTVHTRNIEILGDAFWDIHSPSSKTSEVLSEVNALRRDSRVRGVSYLTRVAWQAAGGSGEPPEDLVLAFALYFSAFATQALTVDFGESPVRIGELTADILTMLLMRAVHEAGMPGTGTSSATAVGTDDFETPATSKPVPGVRIVKEPYMSAGSELPPEWTPT